METKGLSTANFKDTRSLLLRTIPSSTVKTECKPGPSFATNENPSSTAFLTEKKARDAASAVVTTFPSWHTNQNLKTGASKLATLRKKTFEILNSNISESELSPEKKGSEVSTKFVPISVSDITRQILRHKRDVLKSDVNSNSNSNSTGMLVGKDSPIKKEEGVNKMVYKYKCDVCSLRYQDLNCLLKHRKKHEEVQGQGQVKLEDQVTKTEKMNDKTMTMSMSTTDTTTISVASKTGGSKLKPSIPSSSNVKNESSSNSNELTDEDHLKILKACSTVKDLGKVKSIIIQNYNGQKVYICNLCLKIFTEHPTSLQHLLTHSNPEPTTKKTKSFPKSRSQPQTPPTQKKSFNEVDMSIYEDDDFNDDDNFDPKYSNLKSESKSKKDDNLNQARVIHLRCKICDQQFKCMPTLTSHMRSHMNQKNLKSSTSTNSKHLKNSTDKKSTSTNSNSNGQKKFPTRNGPSAQKRAATSSAATATKQLKEQRQVLDKRKEAKPVQVQQQEPVMEQEEEIVIPDQEWPYFDNSGRLYCICNEISYGPMVGCDNDNCPLEWFHFQCVGISKEPVGDWFCPRCSSTMKGRPKKKSRLV